MFFIFYWELTILYHFEKFGNNCILFFLIYVLQSVQTFFWDWFVDQTHITDTEHEENLKIIIKKRKPKPGFKDQFKDS